MYTADEYFNTPKSRRPSGVLVYRGPSELTGGPIAAVVTFHSGNVKTDDMAQVWIICDGPTPLAAADSGQDADVCGDCKHRGVVVTLADGRRKNIKRKCYVTLIHGPRAVADALSRGRYPITTAAEAGRMLTGRAVRLGAYGDPGALPADVVRALVATAGRYTGYTHQWDSSTQPAVGGRGSGPALADVCMASADTLAEAGAAVTAGFRYFRVAPIGAGALGPAEIACPASAEAGKVTTCAKCALCSGRKPAADGRKNIVIMAHGAGASN